MVRFLLAFVALLIASHAEAAFVQLGARGDVVGIFANVQDAGTPGYAVIADDDPRIAAFQARELITPQYQAVIATGVLVTSTGTPSLNATYATDEATQNRLSAIVAGIADGQGLPGGGSTFLHPDITGTPHSFDATQITALAKAIRDFVYVATIARSTLLAGRQASWPSNQITIP